MVGSEDGSKKQAIDKADSNDYYNYLAQIREVAVPLYEGLIEETFTKVEDTYFRFSSRARSNNEQALYFEALQRVRSLRVEITAEFIANLSKGFDRPEQIEGQGEQGHRTLDAIVATETLTLLNNDDLEESIAIEGMVSHARTRFQGDLFDLNERLSGLCGQGIVDSSNNPLDPAQICEAFLLASVKLCIETTTKLLLYKHFDINLLRSMSPILTSANDLLIDAGVSPFLKRYVVLDSYKANDKERSGQQQSRDLNGSLGSQGEHKPPQKSRSGDIDPAGLANQDGSELGGAPNDTAQNQVADNGQARHGTTTDRRQEDYEEVFGVLRGLLSESREFVEVSKRSSGGVSVSQQDLMSVLSTMQTDQLDNVAFVEGHKLLNEAGKSSAHSQNPFHIRDALIENLQEGDKESTRVLGPLDEDVINLVAMLFEFILDDYNLPAPMRALIGRLQIPMLKVAIQDRDFFNRPGHPARKLLNELARASIGWQESSATGKDELFEQMRDVVQTVLQDFSGDVSLFQDLYDQFKVFVERESRRAIIIERRTKELALGESKSRQARSLVGHILAAKLQDKELPPITFKILNDGWSKVLFRISLKEGAESKQWLDAIEVVDDLIWSVQVYSSLEDQQRRAKMLPGLLQRLHQGLSKASFNPFEMSAMFSDLEKVHISVFRAEMESSRTEDISREEGLAKEFAVGGAGVEVDFVDDAAIEQIVLKARPDSEHADSSQGIHEDQSILDSLEEFIQAPSDPSFESVFESIVSGTRAPKVSRSEYTESNAGTNSAHSAEAIIDSSSVGSSNVGAESVEVIVDQEEALSSSRELAVGRSWEELSAVERQQARATEHMVAHLNQVDNLVVGTWFEMVRVDGSLLRCKLMEIYDDAEFVFVGRFGNKVLEKNSYELADDFLNKRIVALDNAPLVDRSINRLMTSLRSKAPKSSAADKERTEPRIEKIECHEVDEGAQFLDQPV